MIIAMVDLGIQKPRVYMLAEMVKENVVTLTMLAISWKKLLEDMPECIRVLTPVTVQG